MGHETAWKRELAAAFTDPIALLSALELTPAQVPGLAPIPAPLLRPERFPLLVPRGFAALMRRGDPRDPLLRQVLPLADEAEVTPGFVSDPVGDHAARRAPGLLQKYRGRALLLATGACAVHCRYCFRRHFAYGEEGAQRDRLAAALAVLENADEIEEVILSGGDPLMLDDATLAWLIEALDRLPQLKRLRLHTRLPTLLPSRITERLCATLAGSRLQPVLVAHVNHAAELGPEAQRALLELSAIGAPLLNQSVLLRGVNDAVTALAELSEALLASRVLPYYLHLLDPVSGAAHFDVPETEARALVTELRQRLPGYLVPRLVRERPGEAAKTVLL
ncbi:EF-P beta-lysylation protein EpmB [Halochromatium salexigens]|uniref:L-lysine 2,3-aminomutase n=1 Tax=Halochromatium salexigens TaxID=49447 RepID=A0AAJ0UIM1_HALSE|nr:EF-P beta-lysylation protein EpmB [Halochromatium salexigens]MBK5932193.1 EF-P beta-lysylation protein EpmB [Halochromatium salexigens]